MAKKEKCGRGTVKKDRSIQRAATYAMMKERERVSVAILNAIATTGDPYANTAMNALLSTVQDLAPTKGAVKQ